MGRITRINPLEDSRWDTFVENHPFGWIHHLSGWKACLEKSFKHLKGYYFVRLDGAGKKIIAGLPVFYVKSRLTGKRLISIPFATLCDPLISNSNDMALLFESVLNLSKKYNVSYIQIRTNLSTSLIDKELFGISNNYKNHYLSLDTEIDDLKMTFHRKTVRQSLNRATRSNLRIKMAENESDLKIFYTLYGMSRKRNGLPFFPFIFFKTLWERFYPKKIKLIMAEISGKVIAGVLFFTFKNRVSLEYGGWDRKYAKICPNHFLYWEAMKLAKNEGVEIFDFGRTSASNLNLMDFKRRWGTKVVDLPQFFYPARTAEKMDQIDRSWKYRLMSGICKHTPNSFQQTIGRFCYRHLG